MSELSKNIKVKTYTFSEEGPHLLITGGVHGDEWEPILAVQQLKKIFVNLSIDIKGKVSLVSIVNEPAYLMGSRTADDGKDLARTCPGDKNGSITEQIAWEISELIQSVDFFIDMHTGGTDFEISPLAGYVLHSSSAILNHQRAMAEAFNLPVVWGTSPNLEGRTLSVARNAGVPAIYTEFGGGGGCNPEIVEVLVKGCFNVMKYLDMIERPETDEQGVKYIIEDFREGSGHLQIMYPSPINGIFSGQKQLGDQVVAGEVLGVVNDPLRGNISEIKALEDGIVFLLRRNAKIGKGEATAGVLPIKEPGKISFR